MNTDASRLPQEQRQRLHNIRTEAKTSNDAGEIGKEIILRRDDGLQNVLWPLTLASPCISKLIDLRMETESQL